VVGALVVVIGAGTAQREGADVFDGGHGHGVNSCVEACSGPDSLELRTT